MKNLRKLFGIIFVTTIIVCAMAACEFFPDPPTPNQTPVAGDYNIGNLKQPVNSVTAVTIKPKSGKSSGKITIYYEGVGYTTYAKSTTLPTAGMSGSTYAVTFNVAAASGWNAATGLYAGTLTIGTQTTITGIAVTTPPAKNQYNLGEELNTTGMVVTATYSDGSTEEVTGYATSGYVKTVLGNQTVTVTYNGKTAEFTVNVIDPTRQTVSTPTANPAAGVIPTGTEITLATATVGAEIWYTTNGNTPAKNGAGSTKYTARITVNAATTIKALAVKDEWNDSGILTAAYTGPTGVTATAASSTSITVNWSPVTWATGYKVYRSTSSSGSYSQVGTAASASYTDTGLNANTTYYYKVSATGSGGESAQSSSVSATTPPAQSTIPTFTSIAEFAAWLASLPTNTAATASSVKLNVSSLGGHSSSAGSAGKALNDNCTKYVSLDLSGSTITSIVAQAFYNCTSLASVTIPNSVTSIEDRAFAGCTSLTGITIPPGVTSIDYWAFLQCSSLSAISVASGNNAFVSDNGVLYNKNKTALLRYPPGKTGSFTIPDSVTSIGSYAFSGCTSLTGVTIPVGVTSIGNWAFYGCTSLTGITIPAVVTSIGGMAFSNCTSLTAISVASGNTSLTAISVASGNTAFTDENGVLYNKAKTTLLCYPAGKTGSFTIPDSVTSIGSYAFFGCTSLTGITIPNSVTSIRNQAFYSCTSLASLTIPDSVTSIGDSAFASCTSLTSVTFQGTIASANFANAFGSSGYFGYIGDLHDKYCAAGGGPGTYTRPSGSSLVWTKQAATPSNTTYIITGSGTSFTATKGGATVGTANQPIQDVINAIRTHATGTNPTIQFGNGTTTLDIGTASASFNNSGGTWGTVMLTGKITSSATTISINDTVSVTSVADIANSGSAAGLITISGGAVLATTGFAVFNDSTGTVNIAGGTIQATGNNGFAVFNDSTGTVNITGGTVQATGNNGFAVDNYSTGTVTISGGTVSATSGIAVWNDSGPVSITGGTVSATSGIAVYSHSTGKITVSGTARVTSANTDTAQGTILLSSNVGTSTRLEITGGRVENTSNSECCNAVRNNSPGAVSISGGTVSATSGYAMLNDFTGTVNITGGTVSTTLGYAVSNDSTGTVNITGGTVSATSGIAVFNYSTGTINITGGTVSAKSSGIAVYGWAEGTITVSGTETKVTSANTNGSEGTIYLTGTTTTTRLEITGGMVENTSATTGNAIYINSNVTVNITGGTVSKAGNGNYAVYKKSGSGEITIVTGPTGATIVGQNYGVY